MERRLPQKGVGDLDAFALLTRPRSLDELIDMKPFYRAHPYQKKVLRDFEGHMVKKHLEEMRRKGLIDFSGGRYRLL